MLTDGLDEAVVTFYNIMNMPKNFCSSEPFEGFGHVEHETVSLVKWFLAIWRSTQFCITNFRAT